MSAYVKLAKKYPFNTALALAPAVGLAIALVSAVVA